MSLLQALLITTGLLTLAVTFLVYRRNKRAAIYQSFLLLGTGLSLWAISLVLMQITKDFVFATPTLTSGLLAFVGFFFLAKTFPDYTGPIPKQFYFYLVPALILIILVPFKVFISDAIFYPDGSIEPINEPAFPIFLLIILGYVIGSIVLMTKKFLRVTGVMREQMRYFFMGLGISSLIIFFADVLLPVLGIFQFNVFGAFSPLIFVGFTSYAIVRHQLMDIRVVIQRGLIYSALASLILLFYVIAINILGFFFQQQTQVTAFISAALTTLIAVFTIPIIDRYLKKITDKVFFKDKYNYQEALHELSEILNENIELKSILRSISKTLKNILKTEKVILLLLPQNILFDETGTFRKIERFYSDKLIKWCTKHPDIIVWSNIPYMLEQSMITAERKEALLEIQRLQEKNKVTVSVPIILGHKLIGFISLGKKLSGDPYTTEDLKLLETFAFQAAIALEKSRLFEEVRDYSQELEKKVGRRTKEIEALQQSQKQMMLDISHGLQTPLTIIKGELSFLKKQIPHNKKVVVFEKSIDEVSTFIYDLLKLARLETVSVDFKKTAFSLSNLLSEQVDYLKTIAKEKNIVVHGLIEKNISILGDEKKIEELINNLVSNAIKYMQKDGEREIQISLKKSKKGALISVADTGIGIGKKDLPHIFTRFYRVKNHDSLNTKGTGLGLAVVKRIVEIHDGTISVTSEVGKGTSFTIVFPIIKEKRT